MNSKIAQDPLNSLYNILETEKSVEFERNKEGQVKMNLPNNEILVEGLSQNILNCHWSLNSSSSSEDLLKTQIVCFTP